MSVAIARAEESQRELLGNLLQLYIYDFSEIWHGTGDVGEDGRFAPYKYLSLYFEKPRYEPLLIRKDGQIAGFAFINNQTWSGEPADYHMGEFFILRRYRRGGVGTEAAHAIFRARPGQWELVVMRENAGAQPFWRKTVAAIGQDVSERDFIKEPWDGPVFRFRIG